MKRAFAALQLRSIVAVFFLLGGLFLTSNRAEAQSYNWKTPLEAMADLGTQVDQYSTQLGALIPGTPSYNDALAHLHYYKEINSQIEGGVSVEQATQSSLSIFNNPSSGFDANPATLDVTVNKTLGQTLYNDAVYFLTY